MSFALATTGGIRTRIIGAIGVYVAAGGVVSLLGWVLDEPRLADWVGTGIAIQPNTTVACIAAGVALLWLSAGFVRVSAALGAFVASIGVTVLFQYLTGLDLGIDQLLLFGRSWGDVGVLSPGRMGTTGSTCWALLGTALALRGASARLHGAVAALGTIVLAISSFSLLGYLFGAEALYSVPWLSVIALQTSTMIAAISVGVIASVPERQPLRGVIEDSAAAMLVRRALPFVLLLPILLGVLRLAGQRAGLYDTPTGVALLVIGLSSMLCAVLWWGAAAVREHELRLARGAEVRAQADLVLREVNEQFLMLDASWRYVAVNDEVCRRTGLSREALIGQNMRKLYPEMVGTEYERLAQRVRETRAPETFEHFYEPWERWLQNRVYPAPGGGIAVFIEDITERKQADLALRENEEKFRSLVSLITDVPWTTSPDGEFVSEQPSWAAFTGQTWDEYRGSGWSAAIHPEDRPNVEALWKQACETATAYESSGRIWHAASQSYRHFVARATPLRNENGAVREWVGTCTDVEDAHA
ncbi:MAG TPA: PAS domain-containing protein, partial [Myxococcota bacterium]|nr:PAS domain-containing protein [Myxococcota bacterium]